MQSSIDPRRLRLSGSNATSAASRAATSNPWSSRPPTEWPTLWRRDADRGACTGMMRSARIPGLADQSHPPRFSGSPAGFVRGGLHDLIKMSDLNDLARKDAPYYCALKQSDQGRGPHDVLLSTPCGSARLAVAYNLASCSSVRRPGRCR